VRGEREAADDHEVDPVVGQRAEQRLGLEGRRARFH
jgi:hypothetical protein